MRIIRESGENARRARNIQKFRNAHDTQKYINYPKQDRRYDIRIFVEFLFVNLHGTLATRYKQQTIFVKSDDNRDRIVIALYRGIHLRSYVLNSHRVARLRFLDFVRFHLQ